jgi:serine/threonine-protein kinase
MAVVYLARDRKHDRPVAIKILRPEIAAGQAAQRFLLEIQILARLQHPHILALLDSGATDERPPRPFYVMPYVDGET